MILAGSALLAVWPAASASASVVSSVCGRNPDKITCIYEITGYGATAAAVEANAATYFNPYCHTAELIAGPEQISGGKWYVEYSQTCVITL